MIQDIVLRFWSKVNKSSGKIMPGMTTECWEWLAGLNEGGYGRFVYLGSEQKAHRVAWVLSRGKIKRGKILCHKCNNRKCVNPEHIYAGTHKDNIRDSILSGTFARGTKSGKAKLTDKQVLKIHGSKLSQHKLAKKFNISSTQVFGIKHRLVWKHIIPEKGAS